jgi:hypothetical protein
MVQTTTVFYTVIKYGKFALLAALLILSFINGHKDYISENPRKFMWDNIAVGGTSAIAFAIIAWMRGRTDLIVNLAFMSFLIFFIYNVFRELSGFNAASSGDGKLTQGEQAEVAVLTKPLMTGGAALAGFMAVLAIGAHVRHPQGFMALLKEAAVFGSMTAIGEAVLARNHGSPVAKTAGVNFGMFFVLHIFLQLGGFYDHIFPPPPILRV